MCTYKAVSLVLLVTILTVIMGYSKPHLISFDFSPFTDSPFNRAVWIIGADAVAAVAGVIGLHRLSR
jgi:hypothetical protein